MPLCYVYTNIPGSSLPEDFEEKLTKCVAETLSKPSEVRVFYIIYKYIIYIDLHSISFSKG